MGSTTFGPWKQPQIINQPTYPVDLIRMGCGRGRSISHGTVINYVQHFILTRPFHKSRSCHSTQYRHQERSLLPAFIESFKLLLTNKDIPSSPRLLALISRALCLAIGELSETHLVDDEDVTRVIALEGGAIEEVPPPSWEPRLKDVWDLRSG